MRFQWFVEGGGGVRELEGYGWLWVAWLWLKILVAFVKGDGVEDGGEDFSRVAFWFESCAEHSFGVFEVGDVGGKAEVAYEFSFDESGLVVSWVVGVEG